METPFAWPPPLSTCVIVAVTYFSCSSPRRRTCLMVYYLITVIVSLLETLYALHAQHAGGVQRLLLEVLPKSRRCVSVVRFKRKDNIIFPCALSCICECVLVPTSFICIATSTLWQPRRAAQSLWTRSPSLACPTPQHPTPPQRVSVIVA